MAEAAAAAALAASEAAEAAAEAAEELPDPPPPALPELVLLAAEDWRLLLAPLKTLEKKLLMGFCSQFVHTSSSWCASTKDETTDSASVLQLDLVFSMPNHTTWCWEGKGKLGSPHCYMTKVSS